MTGPKHPHSTHGSGRLATLLNSFSPSAFFPFFVAFFPAFGFEVATGAAGAFAVSTRPEFSGTGTTSTGVGFVDGAEAISAQGVLLSDFISADVLTGASCGDAGFAAEVAALVRLQSGCDARAEIAGTDDAVGPGGRKFALWPSALFWCKRAAESKELDVRYNLISAKTVTKEFEEST